MTEQEKANVYNLVTKAYVQGSSDREFDFDNSRASRI